MKINDMKETKNGNKIKKKDKFLFKILNIEDKSLTSEIWLLINRNNGIWPKKFDKIINSDPNR